MMTMDLAVTPTLPPDAPPPAPSAPGAQTLPARPNGRSGPASTQERGSFHRLLRDAAKAKEGAPAEKPQTRGAAKRCGERDRPDEAGAKKTSACDDDSPAGDEKAMGAEEVTDHPPRPERAEATPPPPPGDPSPKAAPMPELIESEEDPSDTGPPVSARLVDLLRELGGGDDGGHRTESTGPAGRLLREAREIIDQAPWGRPAALPPGDDPVSEPGAAGRVSGLELETPAEGDDTPASGLGREAAGSVGAPGATSVSDMRASAPAGSMRVAAAGASQFESAPRPSPAAAAATGNPEQAEAPAPHRQLDSQTVRPQSAPATQESFGSPQPPVVMPHAEKTVEGPREQRLQDATRATETSAEAADLVPATRQGEAGRQDGSGTPSGEMTENPFDKTKAAAADDGAAQNHRFELDMREARAQQNHDASIGKTAETHTAARDREVPAGALRAGVFEQIVQRSAVQLNGGGGEVRIDLKPEYLGHVRMQILTENQQVTVRILTELPAVREMIENGLPQLKVDLQQQGLQVARLEVAVSDGHRQHPERRAKNSGGRPPGAGERVSAADGVSAAVAVAPPYRGGRGGTATIDMFI